MDFAFLFFFNDTAPTQIYTLSLHDALPISVKRRSIQEKSTDNPVPITNDDLRFRQLVVGDRSEEHTSELQSRENLVCRLLLEKKKDRLQIRHPPLSIIKTPLRFSITTSRHA